MSKSADAFRTISEVADWLGIPAHVLRFWESKFTQVKPIKRAGGRRYYRPADMLLLGGIRKLLHDEGMTIKGVQKVMRERGVRHVAAMSPPLDPDLEEAIADIALDVTEVEEPRGTVLSFDRAKGDEGQENTPSQAEAPEAEASATSAQAAAEDDPAPSRTTSARDDADTPARPPLEEPEPSAPEVDQTPPPPVAKPAQPDVTEAAQADNDGIDTVADDPPARALRVANVTVPDDPPDDAPAPASPLATLGALDPAILAAQRPALSELAGRMAELRTRMQSGAEPH